MYAAKQRQMRGQAYGGGETVLRETLCCAALRATAMPTKASKPVMLKSPSSRRGFVWIDDLSRTLGEYESTRDQYPTLDAFMPHIIKCLKDSAAELPQK